MYIFDLMIYIKLFFKNFKLYHLIIGIIIYTCSVYLMMYFYSIILFTLIINYYLLV